jgi:hypothetical protein
MTGKARNIEIFEQVVARTLLKLYENFPSPIDLEPMGVGVEVVQGTEMTEEEMAPIILHTAGHSIEFLVREGFITFNPRNRTLSGPEFPDAVLTLKGFQLLGQIPESVDASIDRRTLVQQLGEAVESGAKASIGDAVKNILAGAAVFVGSVAGG